MRMIDQQSTAALATEHQDTTSATNAEQPQEQNAMTSSQPTSSNRNLIREALIIALRALHPGKIDTSPLSREDYAVNKSADVTSYCRSQELLTETQFIRYAVGHAGIAHELDIMIPSAFDGFAHLATLAPEDSRGVQRDLDLSIPEDAGLRAQFRELSNVMHHPLNMRTFTT